MKIWDNHEEVHESKGTSMFSLDEEPKNGIAAPAANQGKKKNKMKGKKSNTEVIGCCYICGNKGFSNALMDCLKCSVMVAHQYCVGIPPGTVDEYTWYCEYCPAPTESPELKSKGKIIPIRDQPPPLQTLLPIPYIRRSEQTETSNECQNAEEDARNINETPLTFPIEHFNLESTSQVVLVVRPSGKVTIWKRETICRASPTSSLETSILNIVTDEETDGCSIQKTIELDYDEEVDDCHSSRTVDITKTEDYTKSFSATVIDACHNDNKEDVIQSFSVLHQEGCNEHKPDAVDVIPIHEEEDIQDGTAGSYRIRSDLVLILRRIIEKHGDIFRNCKIIESSHDSQLLVNICELIQELETVPLQCLQPQHVNRLRNASKELEDSGADIKWLNNHCDYLDNVVQQLSKCTKSKQEQIQCQTSLQCREESLISIRGNLSELLEEIMALEEQLKKSKEYIEKLECSIEDTKSLFRNFVGKSLADGLY
ncbi:uncharacterized protein [Spinacia oleracea]|uniref:Uncharacterized protein isoform X2 n=1 Tax=Spinacia oleracea TaxID=3562 RepID=A0A9R0JZ17_SPIOL|nr:uncharacterized protein LOC110791906 isoform X2 [Spinacia oleracea]